MGTSPRMALAAVLLVAVVAGAWLARAGSTELAAAPGRDAPATAQEAAAGETAPPVGQQPADTAGARPDTVRGTREGQTAQQAILDHQTAGRGPEQPIPFSHRFHVTELRIDCMYCHYGMERTQTGIIPSLEVCMGCHRVAGSGLDPIEELRGHWERNEPVEWEWVNKVPEFVQFTHQPHLRNGIACQECHGPVEEMNRVYQAESFTMGWCLSCHRTEPAATDVATDYRLSRDLDIPPTPHGGQEESLYPLAIDTYYGDWRASIDCLTCHY